MTYNYEIKSEVWHMFQLLIIMTWYAVLYHNYDFLFHNFDSQFWLIS